MIGALVIGTTIVQAGIINPLLVVVIATTALASYSMPSYTFSMALQAENTYPGFSFHIRPLWCHLGNSNGHNTLLLPAQFW